MILPLIDPTSPLPSTADPCSWIDALQARIDEADREQAAASSEPLPPPSVGERRRDKRRPYPQPFYLTPIDPQGEPQRERTFSVIGRNLSEHGVDFYADRPLPDRYLIASFPLPNGEWMSYVVQLTWCRFNRFGWYDNGGRFLRTVPSPMGVEG